MPWTVFVQRLYREFHILFIDEDFDGEFGILEINFVAATIVAANDDVGQSSYLPSKPANPSNDINLFSSTFILWIMLVVRNSFWELIGNCPKDGSKLSR